ncbi:hypothetical protein FHR91_003215, partial [Erythrobacter lutimaris]|nr:hypothetical protein [Alteriqipengyuania lutimaris]
MLALAQANLSSEAADIEALYDEGLLLAAIDHP